MASNQVSMFYSQSLSLCVSLSLSPDYELIDISELKCNHILHIRPIHHSTNCRSAQLSSRLIDYAQLSFDRLSFDQLSLSPFLVIRYFPYAMDVTLLALFSSTIYDWIKEKAAALPTILYCLGYLILALLVHLVYQFFSIGLEKRRIRKVLPLNHS